MWAGNESGKTTGRTVHDQLLMERCVLRFMCPVIFGGHNPKPEMLKKKRSTPVKAEFKGALTARRQIKISVIGRKSGKKISIPVWFVLHGDKLFLLPVHGSDTQWYKNILWKPSMKIDARGSAAELRATPVTSSEAVKSVIKKFQEKYGANDVERYYSKFDAAVVVKLD
jgi:deazaflavin-dependent oxidoreductase (nitroreductase family)